MTSVFLFWFSFTQILYLVYKIYHSKLRGLVVYRYRNILFLFGSLFISSTISYSCDQKNLENNPDFIQAKSHAEILIHQYALPSLLLPKFTYSSNVEVSIDLSELNHKTKSFKLFKLQPPNDSAPSHNINTIYLMAFEKIRSYYFDSCLKKQNNWHNKNHNLRHNPGQIINELQDQIDQYNAKLFSKNNIISNWAYKGIIKNCFSISPGSYIDMSIVENTITHEVMLFGSYTFPITEPKTTDDNLSLSSSNLSRKSLSSSNSRSLRH